MPDAVSVFREREKEREREMEREREKNNERKKNNKQESNKQHLANHQKGISLYMLVCKIFYTLPSFPMLLYVMITHTHTHTHTYTHTHTHTHKTTGVGRGGTGQGGHVPIKNSTFWSVHNGMFVPPPPHTHTHTFNPTFLFSTWIICLYNTDK